MSDMNETNVVRADGMEEAAAAPKGAVDSPKDAPAASKEAAATNGGEEKAVYTADEVRAMLQSEADRRVSGAKKRWERELGDRIEEEAKRLAGEMTSEYAERITALEDELSAAHEKSLRRERALEISAALERAALPGELLPMIEAAEAGTEQALIDALRRTVDECSLAECARRVGTKPPSAAETKRALTSEEIRALPVARLAELMRG